ncbi:MAG TPA: hypothetical protein VHY22_04625 [Chthoniobacteraceae bacterium]|jgi:hypothetical protein|nr:hypothetical protein [Chthoniobacteraceae bacterium]
MNEADDANLDDGAMLNKWAAARGIEEGKPSLAGDKPNIVLPGGSVTIIQSATELYAAIAGSGELFLRGKSVVALQRNSMKEMVLEPVRASAARSLLERHATFWAWRVGRGGEPVLKPTVIPCDTAQALLDCHIAGETLPSITGLSNCPVLCEVSSNLVLCGKGYSRETGLLIQRGDAPPDVALPVAVAALRGLLADFQFQSLGDESRAFASLITPALKMGGLLQGYVPCDVAEADKSQSGKTYRQRIVAAIYGEKPALVPSKRGGVGGTDESLFEKLIAGRPFVQFDNFRGVMDSPALEAFLTAEGAFPCRVPHHREIDVDPTRFFVMLSSNGVETTRDLANRSSIVRIFKREGAQFPDTLHIVRDRQAFFLGSVFAIVREWHRRGKPRSGETRHDFREWCQTLDFIVQKIAGLAPLLDGHIEAQVRVSSPTLTFLRRIAIEVERADRLDEPLSASQIFEIAADEDVPIPGLKSQGHQDEARGRKVIGGKLAALFKTGSTLDLDGFTVTRTEEMRARDGGGDYSAKLYAFTCTKPNAAQGA